MINGRDVVLTEKRGHILLVTLNREERRNALSAESYARWEEEVVRFNDDDDLWVLVLTGAGDVAFSAGMDLKEYADSVSPGGPGVEHRPRRREHYWVPTWKPMIAAINGFAYAGGWDIAQQCDLRIAADTAQLAITEVKWNLPAPFAAEAHNFPTKAIAAEVTLLGRPISAQRAYEIGFVNKVVPPADLMTEAMEWAEHICTLGQESVRAHKQLAYYGRWAPPAEMQGLTDALFYWWGNGKPGVVVDSTVGARAFDEGRQPDFSEMFTRPRKKCLECGAEYVLAVPGSGQATCCGQPLKDLSG